MGFGVDTMNHEPLKNKRKEIKECLKWGNFEECELISDKKRRSFRS